MDNKKTIVVKYGSKCLVNGDGLDHERINLYAQKLAQLRGRYNIIVVSSGSVAAGKRRCGAAGVTAKALSNRTHASLGSAGAALAWEQAFMAQNVLAGQVLVTHYEIDTANEGPVLQQALHENMNSGVVSVVNENDVLSQEELKKIAYGGDNDGLASHLAVAMHADALLLLTSVEGFLIDNTVQKTVKASTIESLDVHFDVTNSEGTGSIKSKLIAAADASRGGVRSFIAHAEADYNDVLSGRVGTQVIQ
ncbi:MAG: hypothetical protein ACR2FM_00885 [Candidatus Saccharimonadales bacterium]